MKKNPNEVIEVEPDWKFAVHQDYQTKLNDPDDVGIKSVIPRPTLTPRSILEPEPGTYEKVTWQMYNQTNIKLSQPKDNYDNYKNPFDGRYPAVFGLPQQRYSYQQRDYHVEDYQYTYTEGQGYSLQKK